MNEGHVLLRVGVNHERHWQLSWVGSTRKRRDVGGHLLDARRCHSRGPVSAEWVSARVELLEVNALDYLIDRSAVSYLQPSFRPRVKSNLLWTFLLQI